jgi:hypothetical protein
VNENVFSIPLNAVVERCRDGQFIDFFHEFGKRNFKVSHDLFPSDFWWIIK